MYKRPCLMLGTKLRGSVYRCKTLALKDRPVAETYGNRVDLGTLEQELSADAPPHGAALFILK